MKEEFPKTVESIYDWARRKLSQSKSILIRKRKTGLASKLKLEFKEDKKGITVTVLAPDYAVFVDQGRSAGKMPPVDVIRRWCRGKNIPEGAAFPIARNIGFFGIPPTRFLDPFRKRVYLKELTNTMEKGAARDVEKEVANDIEKTFN